MATYLSKVQKSIHFKFSWLILYIKFKKMQNDLLTIRYKDNYVQLIFARCYLLEFGVFSA